MSRLITTPRAGHIHRDWDSQPLIQPGRPRRRLNAPLIAASFVLGVHMGLLLSLVI